VNWRAIGCGTLAVAVFVAIGVWGVLRATEPPDCPADLPYEPAPYAPVGATLTEPIHDGTTFEEAGTMGYGLTSWSVWVAPGTVPAASGDPLPARVILRCGDGYQAYVRAGG